MARSSRAKSGETARAEKARASVKRAQPDEASPAAAQVDGPGSPQPAESELVMAAEAGAIAAPPEPPESPAPEAEVPAASVVAAPAPEPEPDSEPGVEPAAGADPDPARHAHPVAGSAPEPAPDRSMSPRQPLPVTGQAPDLTAVLGASRTLVEGTLRARTQMIGFTCRQAEQGLAVGRAMLASGSLPAALALQAEYVGRAFDDALAQSLELSRLSTDLVRAGLQSLRPH